MLPVAAYEERARAKRQARAMRKMDPATITVDVWLGGYRAMFPETRSDQTVWENAESLMAFRRKYGTRLMSAITPIQAQAWTLKHPHQVRYLKHAWDRAVVMQVAPINVWLFVVRPPRTKEKPRAPTEIELATILDNARAPGAAGSLVHMDPFANMIEVAAYTGARQGGLIRLRRKDVDLDAARMVLTEKGNKTRTVVLPAPALEALRRTIRDMRRLDHHRLEGTGNPPLWERSWGAYHLPLYGERLQRKDVQAAWAKVRGDFPHGFHSLRHYAATWLALHGVDPLDIAVQLGHIDAQGRPYDRLVQRVYSHPDPEVALERIVGVLAPAPPTERQGS